jgi:hypothetical protein
MAKLRALAKLMRSKNAGPFSLTYDIMFENVETYHHVIESNVLNPEMLSSLLGVEPQLIRIFHYNPTMAIKITLPRRVGVGDPDDNDLFGGQQFGPLVDLEIPDAPDRTK